MTTPETNGPGEPPRELTVSTAPPPAPRRWWSAVPHHLGRARTSTVVLALLFVGLYTLYLYVRPPDVATAPATGETTVDAPATTAPAEPTETTETSEPAGTSEPTTTAPSTTTPPRTSAVPAPSSPGGDTPVETAAPTQTTAGEEPATTPVPTRAVPTTTGAPGT